jgi:hypothetical protein
VPASCARERKCRAMLKIEPNCPYAEAPKARPEGKSRRLSGNPASLERTAPPDQSASPRCPR